jgi:hypothetical protein
MDDATSQPPLPPSATAVDINEPAAVSDADAAAAAAAAAVAAADAADAEAQAPVSEPEPVKGRSSLCERALDWVVDELFRSLAFRFCATAALPVLCIVLGSVCWAHPSSALCGSALDETWEAAVLVFVGGIGGGIACWFVLLLWFLSTTNMC